MNGNAENTSGDIKQKMQQDASAMKQDLASAARQQMRGQAEAGKERTASQLESLSEAIDQVAASLSETERAGLASYARQTSQKLASLADLLHERNIDEITSEARTLARNNPAVFMLGSVVVGFGLSRFLRASQARDGSMRGESYSGDGPAYRRDFASDYATGQGSSPDYGGQSQQTQSTAASEF